MLSSGIIICCFYCAKYLKEKEATEDFFIPILSKIYDVHTHHHQQSASCQALAVIKITLSKVLKL